MSTEKYSRLKEKKDESESGTDAGKAQNLKFRKFKPQSYDNDGQIDKPEDKDRMTVFMTSIMIAKGMVGAGVVNVSYMHKTLGFLNMIWVALLTNFLVFGSMYCLMGCKDITQRYGYAVYSKLLWGMKGTFISKIGIILVAGCCCISYYMIFGDLLRTLFLIFFEDRWFFNSKVLIVAVGIIVMPLMFSKNISALKKFSFFGIICVMIFIVCLIIVFIIKLKDGEIAPLSAAMLYPNGSWSDMYNAMTGFIKAYSFQVNTFPIYLPLHPRTTKNMIKATMLASVSVTILYIIIGTVGFMLYREKINDSLLIYMREDLIHSLGKKNIIAALLIICQIMYFFNTCISTTLNFFSTKTNALNVIYLLREKLKSKDSELEDQQNQELADKAAGEEEENKNKEIIDVHANPSASIEHHDALKQFETTDFLVNIHRAALPEESLKHQDQIKMQETKRNIIVAVIYFIIIMFSVLIKKLILLEAVAGATASNYICQIGPGLFYIGLSKEEKKKEWHRKFIAYFVAIFGLGLMFGFFIKSILGFIL